MQTTEVYQEDLADSSLDTRTLNAATAVAVAAAGHKA